MRQIRQRRRTTVRYGQWKQEMVERSQKLNPAHSKLEANRERVDNEGASRPEVHFRMI